MSTGILFSVLAGIITIFYSLVSIRWILNKPVGNERMVEISSAIQDGASPTWVGSIRRLALSGWEYFSFLFFYQVSGL